MTDHNEQGSDLTVQSGDGDKHCICDIGNIIWYEVWSNPRMVLTIEQGEARQRCTSKAGRQLRKLLLLRKWKWFWEGRGGWRGNGCLSKVWDYSHGVQNSWATFGAVLNNVNVDICAVAIFLISLLSTQRLIQPPIDRAAQVVPAWQPGCETLEREWENEEE